LYEGKTAVFEESYLSGYDFGRVGENDLNLNIDVMRESRAFFYFNRHMAALIKWQHHRVCERTALRVNIFES
jgi:hypothetical protein